MAGTTPTGTAVIAGVSGIVGRAAAERLIADGWRVVGLSRRPAVPAIPGLEHLAVDMLDRDGCRKVLTRRAADATHVIYAGRAPDPDPAVEAVRNRAMLVNVVEALETAGAPLDHVLLIHGTKWYGSHLGPFRTPASEDDPRAAVPNFYYEQQDWAAERAARSGWRWTGLRPHLLTGFSLGYPHNTAGVIAAHGALCAASGRPLVFPGNQGAFDSVAQITDVRLLVDSMLWAMTEPSAAGDAFNVVNADFFRWRDLWPRIAALFGVEPGGVVSETLAEVHPDGPAAWSRLAAARQLSEPDLGRIADWAYGDYVFRIWWDDMSSTVKIRRAGFGAVHDSWGSIRDALEEYRRRRVIP